MSRPDQHPSSTNLPPTPHLADSQDQIHHEIRARNFDHIISALKSPNFPISPSTRDELLVAVINTFDLQLLNIIFPLLFPDLHPDSSFASTRSVDSTTNSHLATSAVVNHEMLFSALFERDHFQPAENAADQNDSPSDIKSYHFDHCLHNASNPPDYQTFLSFFLAVTKIYSSSSPPLNSTSDCLPTLAAFIINSPFSVPQTTLVKDFIRPFLSADLGLLPHHISSFPQLFPPQLLPTVLVYTPGFRPDMMTSSNSPFFYELCTKHQDHAITVLDHFSTSITFYEDVLVASQNSSPQITAQQSPETMQLQPSYIYEGREYLSRLMNALTAPDSSPLIVSLFKHTQNIMIDLINKSNAMYLKLEGYCDNQASISLPHHSQDNTVQRDTQQELPPLPPTNSSTISTTQQCVVTDDFHNKPVRKTGALGLKVNPSLYLRPLSALCNTRAFFVIEWVKQSLSRQQHAQNRPLDHELTSGFQDSPTEAFSQLNRQSSMTQLDLTIFSIPTNILNICISSIRPFSLALAKLLLQNATQLSLHLDLQVLLDCIYKSATQLFKLTINHFFNNFQSFNVEDDSLDRPTHEIHLQETSQLNQLHTQLNSDHISNKLSLQKLKVLRYLLTAVLTHPTNPPTTMSKEVEEVFDQLLSPVLTYQEAFQLFEQYNISLTYWPFHTSVNTYGELTHTLLPHAKPPIASRFRRIRALANGQHEPDPPAALQPSANSSIDHPETKLPSSFTPITKDQLRLFIREYHAGNGKADMLQSVLNVLLETIVNG